MEQFTTSFSDPKNLQVTWTSFPKMLLNLIVEGNQFFSESLCCRLVLSDSTVVKSVKKQMDTHSSDRGANGRH